MCNIRSLGLFEPGATLTSYSIKKNMLEGKCVFGGTADSRHLKRGKEPKQYTAVFLKGSQSKKVGR